jgi:anti-anti-sigma factor
MTEAQRSISIDEHGDVTVVSLIGEHDMATAQEVRERLDSCVSSDDGLVVSLMHTAFLDSSILRVLVDADEQLKQRQRQLVLHVATASIVERVLDAAVALAGRLPEKAE